MRRKFLVAQTNYSDESSPSLNNLDEQSIAAYYQLIQKLLECPNGEEPQILKTHSDLIEPGLLQTIIAVTKEFDDNGNQNAAKFLTNIALQMGEFLGSDPIPTPIRKQTADILFEWANDRYEISQFLIAFECWQRSLIIYQAIRDYTGEAYTLGNLGEIYRYLGQYERAIDFQAKSLAITKEIKDRKGETVSLGNLGIAYHCLEQYEKAINFQEQSLAISREIKYRLGEANALANLGSSYNSLGQFEQAINFSEESLAISREIKHRLGEAGCLLNLGIAYHSLGQFERAITFHQQYLAISREIKDRPGEAGCLGNLGSTYCSVGEFKQAITFYEQSLAIRREIKDRPGEAGCLLNLGIAYYSLEQSEQAITFYKESLAISREIKDRPGEANSLTGLGNVYHCLGQSEPALAFHQESLAIYREIQDRQGEMGSLISLSADYHALGEYERAINFSEESLAISREIKDRRGEAKSLANLSIAYHSLGEYERAIHFQEHSLTIRREIKDRQGEASSLGNLGTAYYFLGEYERAINFSEESLAISREIKFRRGEAQSLGNLGNTYFALGEYEQAISFHEQSLAIKREIKDREGEASSLGNLGLTYHGLGQFEQAIAFYKQSLAISREIKDSQGEGDSLGNLGLAYHSLGQFEQALVFYERSLVIKRKIKDRQGEASSLESLGVTYNSLGQYERAIDFHEQSLTICRQIKYRQLEAASLVNLGSVYRSLGQYEQAIDFYEQSLTISRQIKDRRGEAASLGNLGNAYDSLEQFEQAIHFQEQSLTISQQIKDRRGEATSLGNLGNAYDSLGQFEQAIHFQEQSLTISQQIKDRRGEAASLGNLGSTYRQLQQPEKALHNYRDSLKIATPKTMPPLCFTAGQNLGDIGFTQGNWHLALEGYEPAMQAVEQLRKGSTTDKRRQEIIKEAISVYANAVQCYINLKQYDKAVETADRSRSRHLADLFASKDLYPQGEIPPEVEEYYRLQQQSNRLRFSDNDPMKALATTRQPTPNGDAIIEKIKELEAEKQQAWLKIRSKDRVLAGQLQPDPLSFDQMQALIPDAETAILNFYTTGEHTHIFILRKNQSTKLYTCEGQGYETLQNWIFDNWLKPYKENPTPWQNQIGKFLSEIANRLQINQLIEQHLNGIKELIIIPHLYLHQIPFAALPLNNIPIPHSDTTSDQTRGLKPPSKPSNTPAKTPPQQPEYLSDKFRIRIVPSCQILSFCHQRGNLKPATMGIVENATGDLIFTGYECETLVKMHKVSENNRLQYQQATISNYQNLLDRVQVLHSSHHASSNLNNSLESKLLLFDGEINLGRLFTWRFSDLAEVFLSCCETNLTLTQITDDPLSIASGFLCAGARNVVSTLWSVEDLATALFCILYYQEKQDKGRSEAIRQAQIKLRNLTGDELSAKYKQQLEEYFEQKLSGENKVEIIKNLRVRLEVLCREILPFVSPYYWSGFVSQGLA